MKKIGGLVSMLLCAVCVAPALVVSASSGLSAVPEKAPSYVIISLILSLLVTFIVVSIMKAQLRSVRKQSKAHQYICAGGLKLNESRDVLLFKTVEKTQKPQSSVADGAKK